MLGRARGSIIAMAVDESDIGSLGARSCRVSLSSVVAGKHWTAGRWRWRYGELTCSKAMAKRVCRLSLLPKLEVCVRNARCTRDNEARNASRTKKGSAIGCRAGRATHQRIQRVVPGVVAVSINGDDIGLGLQLTLLQPQLSYDTKGAEPQSLSFPRRSRHASGTHVTYRAASGGGK